MEEKKVTEEKVNETKRQIMFGIALVALGYTWGRKSFKKDLIKKMDYIGFTDGTNHLKFLYSKKDEKLVRDFCDSVNRNLDKAKAFDKLEEVKK